jgi:hypothetical protein
MGAVAGVEVPETVRAFARAAGADDWLAGLPDLVARLERDWTMAVGPASMYRVGLPIEQRHEILYRVAMRLWRPARDSGLPTGAQ